MNTANRDRTLALIYAATIFVSAFLLFQVQPLVSKYILPWFGGTPAVWTTCMLFFQLLLFAGYAYAHAGHKWLAPRQQALVHLAVLMVVAVLVLWRVLPSQSWMPTDSYHPVSKILLLLGMSIGLPYFVLSTTGPLIQAWFAETFPVGTPYRLYALSNAGSLLALLSYPLIFERWFDIPQQATIWACGFFAFVLLCGYAAVRLRQSPPGDAGENSVTTVPEIATLTPIKAGFASGIRPGISTGIASGTQTAAAVAKPPSIFQCITWLLLPAFASVAFLATTNHVCLDFTPVPFLWIAPLSLYLITLIVAFDQPFWYRPIAFAVFTMITIYGVGLVHNQGFSEPVKLFDGATFKWIRTLLTDWKWLEESGTSRKITVDYIYFVIINFAAMTGICLLCHGELARRRPDSRYLTFFYLMVSAGGALGGFAVAVVAPHVFKTYFEWELSIFLGCLLAIGVILRTLVEAAFRETKWSVASRVGILLPLALALLLPATIEIVDLVQFLNPSDKDVLLAVRNFFGALTVREKEPKDFQQARLQLQHGAIMHGAQFTDPARRGQPTTYYGTPTGVGRTLNWYRNAPRPAGVSVGDIGLGTGTLAAYVGNGDTISFYEINPAVIEITEGGRWFTYLQDSKQRGAEYKIKLGDARLTLKRELADGHPQHFHVLVVDAFSGDAIPAHLLTEEAFAIYVEHLATPEADGLHGALAVHISNRYLDLDPIVRGAAERFNLHSVRLENGSVDHENVSASTWIILSHNEELMTALRPHEAQQEGAIKKPILWTDKHSNLYDLIKRRGPD